MAIVNLIAFIILLIGGINWGLVGIFNWNMVAAIFGGYNVGSIIVYIIVLLAAIWLIISAIIGMGLIALSLSKQRQVDESKRK